MILSGGECHVMKSICFFCGKNENCNATVVLKDKRAFDMFACFHNFAAIILDGMIENSFL